MRRDEMWLRTKQFYGSALRLLINSSFGVCERLGFHVTLSHYYEPVPDIRKLKDDLWLKQSELVGLDMNEHEQFELLSLFVSQFKAEYDSFPEEKPATPYQFYMKNGGFPSVDAEILYCMIRHFRPRRLLEIGSGNSTYLSAQAIRKNREEDHAYECELTAIEPYPNEVLKAGFPGLSRLIAGQVQDVPFDEFRRLQENDILFVDSSHVLKIGSDVQYECLEVLPRLNRGVLVHIHDVFFPAEYPKDLVVEQHRFWTEQYLLQAFLAFNERFEVLWAGNYMHLRHPDCLATAFKSYQRGGRWPGSFWIRRVK